MTQQFGHCRVDGRISRGERSPKSGFPCVATTLRLTGVTWVLYIKRQCRNTVKAWGLRVWQLAECSLFCAAWSRWCALKPRVGEAAMRCCNIDMLVGAALMGFMIIRLASRLTVITPVHHTNRFDPLIIMNFASTQWRVNFVFAYIFNCVTPLDKCYKRFCCPAKPACSFRHSNVCVDIQILIFIYFHMAKVTVVSVLP